MLTEPQDRHFFYSPEAEAEYYLPPSDPALPFYSLAIYSDRMSCWVPLLWSGDRLKVAGVAARCAEGGFIYWVHAFAEDDEPREVASWLAMPSPDSLEFRSMLERAAGMSSDHCSSSSADH